MPDELEDVSGELRAERRRLAVDAVGAAHADRVAVAHGLLLERRDERVELIVDELERVAHHHALRGVDDVVGREPVVDVAPFLTARLLHL